VFNLQGSELVIILLLALVVLGPEKLPDAMRKLGQFYAELRKMSNSFQKEFKAAVDEPMREVRETANILRDSADFRKFQSGERSEKPKSADVASPAIPASTPTSDVPFARTTGAANGEAALEAPLTLAPPTGRPRLVAPPTPAGVAGPTVAPSSALPGPVDGWVAPNGDQVAPPPPPGAPPAAPPPAPAEETAT
jgi:sec-independent protein translocase protein TatB